MVGLLVSIVSAVLLAEVATGQEFCQTGGRCYRKVGPDTSANVVAACDALNGDLVFRSFDEIPDVISALSLGVDQYLYIGLSGCACAECAAFDLDDSPDGWYRDSCDHSHPGLCLLPESYVPGFGDFQFEGNAVGFGFGSRLFEALDIETSVMSQDAVRTQCAEICRVEPGCKGFRIYVDDLTDDLATCIGYSNAALSPVTPDASAVYEEQWSYLGTTQAVPALACTFDQQFPSPGTPIFNSSSASLGAFEFFAPSTLEICKYACEVNPLCHSLAYNVLIASACDMNRMPTQTVTIVPGFSGIFDVSGC